MNEETVEWLLTILPFGTAGLLFILLLLLAVEGVPMKVLGRYAVLKGLLRDKRTESRWYGRSEQWLRKNGAAFHYGAWVNPISFLALRMVLAVGSLCVVAGVSLKSGVLVAVFLYLAPGWMLFYLNSRDNVRLLPEIKLIYHALEMQIRAGVYVTDALAECYSGVREARMRQALLDLAGDVVMKADIYEALDHFQGKFDNPYVDSLCITLLQALETGQAVELLRDIAEQVKDMESTVLERQKAALDRSITFYQLGVLAAVMGVVLYACVSHMFTAAVHF